MKKQAASILVVDDEAYVRDSIRVVLERNGYSVRTESGPAALTGPHALDGMDVVITDLKMGDGGGLELIKTLKGIRPELPVIVLTAFGSVPKAVECMKAGAYEFLEKPAEPDELLMVLQRALREDTLRRELEYLRTESGTGERVRQPIGRSPGWRKVLSLVEAAAPTDASVLLLGESGTGKEEVARLIHRRSLRRLRPFVSVNCAAVPLELFESEFFGHRKGAFTGATRDREGRFRVAHEGTLFLDEIGCLPDSAQSKVLRVLEEGVFERVGESRSTQVDVRLISATNSDLEEAVEAGKFRRDLFYRINVITIRMPPLRERREDIELLAEAFMKECSQRVGKPVKPFTPEVLRAFRNYAWPGNIRELRNVVERAVILEPGDAVTLDSIPENLLARAESAANHFKLRSRLLDEERRALAEALHRAGGVRRQAAQLLGIDERNLSYYLKKHGLAGWKLE